MYQNIRWSACGSIKICTEGEARGNYWCIQFSHLEPHPHLLSPHRIRSPLTSSQFPGISHQEPHPLLLSHQWSTTYCSHPRGAPPILLSPQRSPTYCSHLTNRAPPTALTSLRPTHSCWPQEVLLYSQSYYRRVCTMHTVRGH